MLFSKRLYKFFSVFVLLNAINRLNGLDSNTKNHTKLSTSLQIDPQGYFDIQKKPEEFVNKFNKQIVSFP